MGQDQYVTHTYKEEYQNAKNAIARLEDFLDYLFEHSEHCDHITRTDAWAEFEAWEEKEYRNEKNNQHD